MRYTLTNWEKYNSTPAPIFKTRKEAQREAEKLRLLRAWVEVEEVQE